MERIEELKNKLCKELDEYAGLKQFDRNSMESWIMTVDHIIEDMGTGDQNI